MQRMHRPFVVLVALTAFPALAAAQGLGDASKKEKERREQGKAANAKTYTQQDLAGLPPVATGSGSTEGASMPASVRASPGSLASGRPSAADGGDSDRRRQQEMQWRARASAAEARVESARKRYETLSSMNLVPGYEYQDSRGRTVIGSVGELQKMTAAARAELDAAVKARDDLHEEARHANVPPGWLR